MNYWNFIDSNLIGIIKITIQRNNKRMMKRGRVTFWFEELNRRDSFLYKEWTSETNWWKEWIWIKFKFHDEVKRGKKDVGGG